MKIIKGFLTLITIVWAQWDADRQFEALAEELSFGSPPVQYVRALMLDETIPNHK